MRSKSRCTGCPIFTMCLGEPGNIRRDNHLVIKMCPHCLNVMYGGKTISIKELCEGLYSEFMETGVFAESGYFEGCGGNDKCREEERASSKYSYTVPIPMAINFKKRRRWWRLYGK